MSEFFYNTINLQGDRLLEVNVKAMYQTDIIAEIYKANPKTLISPAQILFIVQKKYGFNWPITSCRRAITNLSGKEYEDRGYGELLTKTTVQVTGLYGLPEHQWLLTAGNEKVLSEIKWTKESKTTAADYANALIAMSKTGIVQQQRLFNDQL